MDKSDHTDKMNTILSDESKFKKTKLSLNGLGHRQDSAVSSGDHVQKFCFIVFHMDNFNTVDNEPQPFLYFLLSKQIMVLNINHLDRTAVCLNTGVTVDTTDVASCLNINGKAGTHLKTGVPEGNCLENWSSLRLEKLLPSRTGSENFLPNTYSACNEIPGQCTRERICKTLETDRRNTTCVQHANVAVYECNQLYTCLVRVCLWSEIEDGQYYIEILTVDELIGRSDPMKEQPKLEEQLVLASYRIGAEILASLIEDNLSHLSEEYSEASGTLSRWALALVISITTLGFLVALTVLLLLIYRRYRFSYQTSDPQLSSAADLM
ncbi:hypothetical protein CLF_110670 [Clonorchis sinensis]|uniref:Uncharacterized protein n=1 Tax=Clonorchis sinensis TaxID=79923 RepID=G7YTR1_CLOSI|nr:hypothetical protein CLF_110670 [Clonorchis sinensis]